jgi:hypothetical protein
MKTIKLMAEYGAFPLWESSSERVGDIDPGTLPLSAPLQEKLKNWAAVYDATLDMDDPRSSGFKTDQEVEEFRKEGLELSKQLQHELLPFGYTVIVKI